MSRLLSSLLPVIIAIAIIASAPSVAAGAIPQIETKTVTPGMSLPAVQAVFDSLSQKGGGRVVLGPGTYDWGGGTLRIGSGIELDLTQARFLVHTRLIHVTGADDVRIRGGVFDWAMTRAPGKDSPYPTAIWIDTSSRVIVEGGTYRALGNGGTRGIYANCQNCTFTRNAFLSQTAEGIFLWGSPSFASLDNNIVANSFSWCSIAIKMHPAGPLTNANQLRNSVLRNAVANFGNDTQFYIQYTQGTAVIGNVFNNTFGSRQDLIALTGSTNATIYGNSAIGSGAGITGVRLSKDTNVSIRHNSFANVQKGVRVTSDLGPDATTNVTVEYNNFKSLAQAAVLIQGNVSSFNFSRNLMSEVGYADPYGGMFTVASTVVYANTIQVEDNRVSQTGLNAKEFIRSTSMNPQTDNWRVFGNSISGRVPYNFDLTPGGYFG